jgi:hypothetical protein
MLLDMNDKDKGNLGDRGLRKNSYGEYEEFDRDNNL